MEDAEIIGLALEQNRVIVTEDSDFAQLAFFKGMTHAGIVQLNNISFHQQLETCLQTLERHSSELASGAVVIVSANRTRVRFNESEDM